MLSMSKDRISFIGTPYWKSSWNFSSEDVDYLKINYEILSHEEMALALCRTPSSIKNKCWRLRLISKEPEWTNEEYAILEAAYTTKGYVDLDGLSKILNRGTDAIQIKASRIGLGNKNRPKCEKRKERVNKFATKEERDKCTGERFSKMWEDRGHPRGMLGKHHSEEVKFKLSITSKEAWSKKSDEEKGEMILKAALSREKNGNQQTINRANASWGCGWREIGGIRKYYRSKWEANYARYLQWLKERGEIMGWEHEPHTFWFEGIKRGCLSYLPDFRVTEKGGSIAYHEVKGWMDDRSKTKIKRMAKYHPSVKLIVIEAKAYASIKKVMMPIIKGWEVDSKGR